jgi:hypothetical protein
MAAALERKCRHSDALIIAATYRYQSIVDTKVQLTCPAFAVPAET